MFVTGDHEYSGEETLPLIAAELEKNYGFRTRVLKAFPDHNSEENIPGLEALKEADLVVFFLRWRRLPFVAKSVRPEGHCSLISKYKGH